MIDEEMVQIGLSLNLNPGELNMLDLLASQVDSQQQWCFRQFLPMLQIKEAESLGRIQAILAAVDSLPDEVMRPYSQHHVTERYL